jgi:hypothetical protein
VYQRQKLLLSCNLSQPNKGHDSGISVHAAKTILVILPFVAHNPGCELALVSMWQKQANFGICTPAVTGTLKGYDQLLNLVLDEAIEFERGTTRHVT